ncbi:MAG: DUF309 domain-containing protein [Cyclonatronaceae bacterium]
MTAPPRYAPEIPLPPYAYVSGHRPHPKRDPNGHGQGPDPGDIPALADLRDWQGNRIYLGGIDLFNHGYYREAHEMWEALWHRTGGDAVTAMFLKGLIKLTATGVKIREGNTRGARKHAGRAKKSFERVWTSTSDPGLGGLDFVALCDFCDEIERAAGDITPRPDHMVEIVFDRCLLPGSR